MSEVTILLPPRTYPRTGLPDSAGRVSKGPARLAQQLALAYSLQSRLDTGEFPCAAELARALGFTHARITQLLDLLLLAPDIQEEILFLECQAGRQPLTAALLRPIIRLALWDEQRRAWRDLASKARFPVFRSPQRL